MANVFDLEIITPSSHFYKGKVEMVTVQTVLGQEAFMAGHARACKLLAAGDCKLKEQDPALGAIAERTVTLTDGYVDVEPDRAVIYTDAASWQDA